MIAHRLSGSAIESMSATCAMPTRRRIMHAPAYPSTSAYKSSRKSSSTACNRMGTPEVGLTKVAGRQPLGEVSRHMGGGEGFCLGAATAGAPRIGQCRCHI